MSRRLRASIRANRSRSLRPRTSQVPPEPTENQSEAEAPLRESLADALQVGSIPEEGKSVPPSAGDLHERVTVREPSIAPRLAEELGEQHDAAGEPQDEVAEAPIEAASSTQPSEASPIAAEEQEEDAVTSSPAEPRVPAQQAPLTPADAPLPIGEAVTLRVEATPLPVEAPAEPMKVEEPKAAAKVEKKVEEPKVTAKGEEKAEEPKAAAKVEKKAEEPKVAAKGEEKKAGKGEKKAEVKAAKAEDSKPISSRRPARAKAEEEAEREAAEPEVKRPQGRPAHEEEIDASSVSAEFFRRDEGSLNPHVDSRSEEMAEEQEEHAHVVVLSPSAIARRARLRRLVAGVVAFAGVISIAVVGKTLAASKRSQTTVQAPPPAVVETKQEAKQPEAKPEVKQPEAKQEVKAPEAKAPEVPSATPSAAASAEPKAEEKKPEEKKPEATADAAALKKETERLLNRGARKEAIEKAKEAIAADPTDAMPYLYLGSALQDSGKWKEGIEAYSECVRHATKGPVNECRAMGGKK